MLAGKWKIPLSARKKLPWRWSNTGAGVQKACGISTLGDTQNSAAQDPEESALDGSTLGRSLFYLHRSLFTSAVLWLYEQNPNRIQERDFASVCSSTLGGSSLAATHKICTQQQAATARAITTALGKWSCLSSQERSVWGCSAGSVCAKHWFDDLNGAADLLFLLGSCNTLTRLALWKTQARSAALMTVMYPW